MGGQVVVLTFQPHPIAVLAPGQAPPLLQSLHDRLARLRDLGVDVAVLQRFTRALRRARARGVRARLPRCATSSCCTSSSATTSTSGATAPGTVETLRALGARYGFARRRRSARSRSARRAGEQHGAPPAARRRATCGARGALLGRPYALRGRVVRGERRGRTLGFPTANLHLRPGLLLPPDGVYAVARAVDGRAAPGVLNIGVRPTFGELRRTIEAHLLDFDGDLYGRWLALELVERLRGERRFAGPDALRAAIAADVARAREVLARAAPAPAPEVARARRVVVGCRPTRPACGSIASSPTLPELGTRSQAKRLIDAGRVRVDGAAAQGGARAARRRARRASTLPPPEPTGVEPEALPLVVLYEDAHLLAIDKPPGMVVHPAPGARRGTVVNALAASPRDARRRRRPRAARHRASARPRHVGRAAGGAHAARRSRGWRGSSASARSRSATSRSCTARSRPARGVDRPADRPPSARAPAHERPARARARGGHALRGRRAASRRDARSAWRPRPGRTHQLRVHLAALGHPIVGDRVYGGARRRARRGGRRGARRLPAAGAARGGARASRIPVSGAPVVVRAPLPRRPRRLLAGCAKPARRRKSPRSA